MKSEILLKRLLEKSHAAGDCIIFNRSLTPSGYGYMWNGKRNELVHRIAYRIAKGEIPEGLEVDHACKNRSCINPEHLEAVTHAVNMERAVNANRIKTHCKRGHELSPENVYMEKYGSRRCITCRTNRRNKPRELL